MLTSDRKINLVPEEFAEGLRIALAKPPSASKEFPLMLISGGRRLASFNTWTHNLPSLMQKLTTNYALMNVNDGRGCHVKDGDKIKITSATESIEIQVSLSDKIRSGVIMVHQFWGHDYKSGQTLARENPGVNVNVLHDDQVRDSFTGMPVFNGTPCRVNAV